MGILPKQPGWDPVRAFTRPGRQLAQPPLHLLHRDNELAGNLVQSMRIIFLLQGCEVGAHRVQELVDPVSEFTGASTTHTVDQALQTWYFEACCGDLLTLPPLILAAWNCTIVICWRSKSCEGASSAYLPCCTGRDKPLSWCGMQHSCCQWDCEIHLSPRTCHLNTSWLAWQACVYQSRSSASPQRWHTAAGRSQPCRGPPPTGHSWGPTAAWPSRSRPYIWSGHVGCGRFIVRLKGRPTGNHAMVGQSYECHHPWLPILD